jgi:hypothetical protein
MDGSMPGVPSTDRSRLAQRLRELQRARARLTPLPLDQLRVLLPAEASRACELGRVTMEEGLTAQTEPVLTAGWVSAPLVHLDRTLGVLRGDARPGRELDELDRELLWAFATATAPLLHVATLAAIARAPAPPDGVVEHRRGPRRRR